MPVGTPQDLTALTTALRSGRISLPDALAGLQERFARIEPVIQAFVPEAGRFDRLAREAAALAERFPDPSSRPPLFGVPVGVKDIFHATGFLTRAGSRLPAEVLAGAEGPVVGGLRRAGALLLGKTRTTEFAYFAPAATRNPRNPEHTPGGSSSGSAAAVAAGLVPLALGTQTSGSIIRPAAYCGVVGVKPSLGRLSTAGVIPFSSHTDHVGFFTASVADAVLAASVLCPGGADAPADGRPPVLGVPEGPLLDQVAPEALAVFYATLETLARSGITLRPAPVLDDLAALKALHRRLIAADLARAHAAWYPRYQSLYHPLTAGLIEEGLAVPETEIPSLAATMEALRRDLTGRLDALSLSAFACPAATGPAPAGLSSTGDPVMNLPWTHAGLPAVTVPAGTAGNGLPLGLQLVGRFGRDAALLALARRIEAALTTP